MFKVPPEIQDDGQPLNLTVTLKQPLTLGCDAFGIPSPTITWTKDDRPVSFSPWIFFHKFDCMSVCNTHWLPSSAMPPCGHSPNYNDTLRMHSTCICMSRWTVLGFIYRMGTGCWGSTEFSQSTLEVLSAQLKTQLESPGGNIISWCKVSCLTVLRRKWKRSAFCQK